MNPEPKLFLREMEKSAEMSPGGGSEEEEGVFKSLNRNKNRKDLAGAGWTQVRSGCHEANQGRALRSKRDPCFPRCVCLEGPGRPLPIACVSQAGIYVSRLQSEDSGPDGR